MRLVIAGSRTVSPTLAEVEAGIATLRQRYGDLVVAVIEEVISGDAAGADNAGAAWAVTNGVPVHHEPIQRDDITTHGKYLGPRMRNRRMAERGDAALLFWDGRSGGTADMCIRMVARGKPVLVVPMRARSRRRLRG